MRRNTRKPRFRMDIEFISCTPHCHVRKVTWWQLLASLFTGNTDISNGTEKCIYKLRVLEPGNLSGEKLEQLAYREHVSACISDQDDLAVFGKDTVSITGWPFGLDEQKKELSFCAQGEHHVPRGKMYLWY